MSVTQFEPIYFSKYTANYADNYDQVKYCALYMHNIANFVRIKTESNVI